MVSRSSVVPYGHLLIDLTPKTVHSLRFCSKSGSVLAKFHLPAGRETKFVEDEYAIRLYSANTSKMFSKASNTIHSHLFEIFFSVSERVFCKTNKRRVSRISERKRVKYRMKKYLKFNYRVTIDIYHHLLCHSTIEIVWISLF